MKKLFTTFIAIICVSLGVSAQNTGIGTTTPDTSAKLEVNSTTQGFLPPRMTTAQRDAIANPAEGLWIYNLDTDCMNYYNNATNSWKELCGEVTAIYCGGGPTVVAEVVNATTAEIWMDRNLGASQQATAYDDTSAYGDLYQWGRYADGHQCRDSQIIATYATTPIPNTGNVWDGKFITTSNIVDDWLTSLDDSLWQGESGTNNPCPSGFRIPTQVELESERLSWTIDNNVGAYNSPLKLVVAGWRWYNDGSIGTGGGANGLVGNYWSSTVTGNDAYYLVFYDLDSATHFHNRRAFGNSVRCIKD